MIKYSFVIALIIVLTSSLRAQSITNEIGTYLLKTILPSGYEEGLEMRLLLRSSEWKTYRETVSDTTSMNAIYQIAFMMCNGRSKEALLTSGVAVLDHRLLPIKLPFGLVLNIPLTLESEEQFNRRASKLPAHIYSPDIADRDKLQHFFFSAYLKRVVKMNLLTSFVGNMTEIIEDAFVIGGANDPRDKHANADGTRFGLKSAASETALPTESLTPNP